VQWTAETLNTAFAKYPLLPEHSPALQVFAGLALSAVGLDTVTDFAALISGRDPLTGRELTSHDLFITWLAFSIPLVSASMMYGFADDAGEIFFHQADNLTSDSREFRLIKVHNTTTSKSLLYVPEVNVSTHGAVQGVARGHGAIGIERRTIKIPANCSVTFWCSVGSTISDKLGRQIEENIAPQPFEFFGPGDTVGDHLLLPSSAGSPLRFSNQPVGEVIEVHSNIGIRLSEIFEMYPDGIDLRWAACRYIPGVKTC